jgi:hypothetical protein
MIEMVRLNVNSAAIDSDENGGLLLFSQTYEGMVSLFPHLYVVIVLY